MKMTCAFNPNGEITNSQRMSVNRKRTVILDEDFLAVAQRQGVNRALTKRSITRVKEATANWSCYAQRAVVSDEQAGKIAGLLNPP